MRIVRFAILALNLALLAGAGLSLWLRFHDKTESRFMVVNFRWLGVFFLGAGALFSLPVFLSREYTALWFSLFSIPVLYAALVTANQRVRWDQSGFWYRTAFRREIRYEYEDIRRMRTVGTGKSGSDLFVNVNGRRFLLDETTPWEIFAGAYADWQSRNQRPTWRKQMEISYLERYRRHGPFGKKLDRIPHGRFLLGLALTWGAVLSALSIAGFVTAAKPSHIVFSVLGLLFSLYALIHFLYAAAHIDDKPRLIHRWMRGKIRPDPDHPVRKVYHRKRG